MTDICRLCASLKQLRDLLNIKSEQIENKLQILNIVLVEDEEQVLPQNACLDCISGLDTCIEYIDGVNKAQETIRQAFFVKLEDNLAILEPGGTENSNLELRSDSQEEQSQQDEAHNTESVIEVEKPNDEQWFIYNPQDNTLTLKGSDEIFEFKHTSEEDTNEITKYTEHDTGSVAADEDDAQDYGEDLLQEDNIDENDIIAEQNDDGTELINYVNNHIQEQHKEINMDVDGEHYIFQTLDDSDKNIDGTITNLGLMKLHLDTWEQYVWKCSECALMMNSVQELRSHYKDTHEMQHSVYCCVDCAKHFVKYATFINHVRKRHRTHLKYSCDICYTYYWNTKLLKKHRTVDHSHVLLAEDEEECGGEAGSGTNSNTCWLCEKSFKNGAALRYHKKSHLPSQSKEKYECDVCEKTFMTKPNLMAHKKIHSGIREYTCNQCGKAFVQKVNLENHMLTHIPSRPYLCDDCGKTFKSQVRLNNHMTVHSGLKPYSCDVCGRKFREKGTLRDHHRIHTGVMPFKCEFCDKRFRFKGILTTHRRQHTGERPYSCLDCNHHFTNWPNFNKHMKRRHGINTSVSVRKPQAIPPSGMPPQAKLNYVVPTIHNRIDTKDVTRGEIIVDDEEEEEEKGEYTSGPSNESQTEVVEIQPMENFRARKETVLSFYKYQNEEEEDEVEHVELDA